MIDSNIVKVRVKGDYACFTQPALKVERMTYPCMTPSAARGILECILWKPEMWPQRPSSGSAPIGQKAWIPVTARRSGWIRR